VVLHTVSFDTTQATAANRRQALTPSSFTEVSATTGQLIPLAYTGTYGTNGFKLNFSDNSTTAALGADTSGNSNNWTPNNFSVAGGPNTVTTPASNAPPTIDYLVVAGGGGGSNGGGGAGGLRSTVTATGGGGSLETALSVAPATSYTVTIGAGGAGQNYATTNGSNGGDSVFSSITAIGGGGGAWYNDSGNSGGSGGGGGRDSTARIGGTGTANQGFGGGSGNNGPYGPPGGGGGAGAVGPNGGAATPPATKGPDGGAGVAVAITGSSVYYGGGGAGGSNLDPPDGPTGTPLGGVGGGGNGNTTGNTAGTNATANTGGGGGGGEGSTNGNGGSGIVILRYANTYGDLTVGSGLTYTYANTGGYKIYSFTASATAAQSAGNDSLVDTPTSYGTGNSGGDVRGNYATLNPLQKGSDLTLSNGNLDLAKSSTVDNCTASTIGMTSGKWYFELTITNLGGGEYAIGFGKNIPIQSYMGSNATTWSYADTGSLMTNGNTTSYGSSYTTGDILGAAFDGDNGTLTFYKNGTSQGTAATGLTQGPYFFAAGAYNSAATRSANFGQRAFAYPVSGFKALCDTNLGAPVVAKPNTLMDVALWTGNTNGTTQTISRSWRFQPDFVWLKDRSGATPSSL
jgi:hypothetical protein